MSDELRSYMDRLADRARRFGLLRGDAIRSVVEAPLAAIADQVPEPYQSAIVVTTATMPLRCARRRNHRIHVGQPAAFVPGLGWCCELCAT